MLDIRWPLLTIELGLSFLAVGCILAELFLPKSFDRSRALPNLGMIGLAGLLVVLIAQGSQFGSTFSGSFIHDGLSVFFKGFFLITGFFILHMAKTYRKNFSRGQAEFVLLILFSLIGMCFLVSSNDFLLFFVALETLAISMLVITAYLRTDERSIEAGVKFLVLGALSTALLVYGLSFIYGATGSMSFVGIQTALMDRPAPPPAFIFGMILVLSSLAFKLAVFPFHFWVPDVYQGAPTPLTAFLAVGSKAAAVGILVRLLMTVFMPSQEALRMLFAVLAAATVLYGNLGAIPQKNIKRLLAYSSIGHAGYLMIGFASFWHTGKEAILYYLMAYLFSTLGAFLVVVWVSSKNPSDEIEDYAGLSQRSPLLAAGMLLALCSLAGLPPLAGFFGKFLILSSAVKAGLGWLALIGILNVVTSLYYYLRVVQKMYFDEPKIAGPLQVSVSQRVMQFATMAGIIILGIYPGPFIRLVQEAFMNFIRL